MSTPEEEVAEFLTTEPIRATKCSTCSHPQAELINRAIRAFSSAKSAGDTTQDWRSFHNFLVERYDYSAVCHSMRRHMRECLDLP